MATPSFLRNLSPRVKSLSSPVVWAPLTIAALLGVFVWEFRKNPDWFNRDQATNLNPDTTLTADEQARLSEIDTLDLLLEQSRISGSPAEAGSLVVPQAGDLTNEATAADGAANSRKLSGREDPFGEYAAEYAFPGSAEAAKRSTQTPLSGATSAGNSATISSGGSGSVSGGASSGSFNFGNGLVNPSAPATNSALSEALGRQQAEKRAAAAQENNSASSSSDENVELGSPASVSSGGSAGSSGSSAPSVSPLPAAGQRQSSFEPTVQPSGGISVPFNRTTTNMSPPVGTTGYQTPASSRLPVFNVEPVQPTRNPSPTRNPVVPSAAPSAAAQPATVYTAPTSVQPTQNRQR